MITYKGNEQLDRKYEKVFLDVIFFGFVSHIWI